MNQEKTLILKEKITKDPKFSWVNFLHEKFSKTTVYVVGGGVRDFFLNRETHDYDFMVTKISNTDLEEFLNSQGELNFVGKSFGVYIFRFKDTDKFVEIALPRTDASFNTGGYRDVQVTTNPDLPIEEDLMRRDFTINAMAVSLRDGSLIDPFNGLDDCKNQIIKAVGDPEIRFKEDYSRIMRGVRFASVLNFIIEPKTKSSMKSLAKNISTIAKERVQEEVKKILLSKNLLYAFNTLAELKLLDEIFPELTESYGVEQGKAHIYNVFEHLVRAAQHASEKEYSHEIIMAALFHDCGKPRTKKIINGVDTYYQHEYVGEKMAREALNRLKYPKDFVKHVSHLVKNHMFYYNEGEISDAGVRRLIAKVGPEYINDLLKLRFSDRVGMGRPKAKPKKLVELEERIAVLQTDPITENMIVLDGNRIMEILKIQPSIRLKFLKKALLSDVLDNPKRNTLEYLEPRVTELNKLSDEELKKLAPDLNEEEAQRKQQIIKELKRVE